MQNQRCNKLTSVDCVVRMTQPCFLEVMGGLKLLELSHWSSRYYMAGSKNKKDV